MKKGFPMMKLLCMQSAKSSDSEIEVCGQTCTFHPGKKHIIFNHPEFSQTVIERWVCYPKVPI